MVRKILNSSLPDSEKSFARLLKECYSVTLAGTETTGAILSATAFYLLSQEETLGKLQEEIGDAEASAGRALNLQELRDLPYLVCFSGLMVTDNTDPLASLAS